MITHVKGITLKIRLDNKNGERTTFTPRQSVINNIVGSYTERITQEYISTEIVPKLKKSYEYVKLYGPNVRIFTQDSITALKIIKLVYPASWVLPPECERVYIKKTTDEIGNWKIVDTACKQGNIFEIVSTDYEAEALKDLIEDLISNSCFVTKRSKEGLLRFYKILKESRYAPDFIIIALDVVGEKSINVSSQLKELQIRTTFQLPVVEVKKLIVIETKSTNPPARVEFSTSQKKFFELFSDQDIAEFLLIYIPINNVIPLKNIPLVLYHFSPGETINVKAFRQYRNKQRKNTWILNKYLIGQDKTTKQQ